MCLHTLQTCTTTKQAGCPPPPSSPALQCGCDAMVIGSRGLGLTRRAMLALFGLGSGGGSTSH